MNTKLKNTLLSLVLGCAPLCAATPPAPCGAVPTEQQLAWQRMEWYAFVHFGLNTYTGREWGYGDEDEKQFNPTDFNANAIAATFKKAGMTGLIYTAKHHDGWCAWPSKSTKHNITRAAWKNGRGDVVKDFANACKKNGLRFGVYISPWDRNCAEYGREGYLKVYYKQIEELLTQYGPIFEIWFDGANGGDGFYGGAREKRNIGKADDYYNFTRVVENIRKLQPNCIIWGAAGRGDATWGGSEQGFVKYPYWNVVTGNPDRDERQLRTTPAQPAADEKWLVLEADTTINGAGWFWHPNQAGRVKSPEKLMDIYLTSVGRGANLILNVAPDRSGRLDEADVKSLLTFGEARRKLLAKDYALHAAAEATEVRGNDRQFAAAQTTDGDIETYWCPNDGTTTGSVELTLPKPATFDVVRLREQIRLGQRVLGFTVEARVNGTWQEIDKGESIGNQVLRKLNAPVTADKVRLTVTGARACPCISEISLLKMPEIGSISVQTDAPLKIKWQSKGNGVCTADFGKTVTVGSVEVAPRKDGKFQGMVNRFRLEVSDNGKDWRTVCETELGNLRANPIEQRISFDKPVTARCFRFTPTGTLEPGTPEVGGLKLYEK